MVVELRTWEVLQVRTQLSPDWVLAQDNILLLNEPRSIIEASVLSFMKI